MSAPIGPNMWAECVESYDAGRYGTLVAGRVYFVVEVWEPESRMSCGAHGEQCCGPCVSLRDDGFTPDEGGWCARQFRPIGRDTTELFRSLLAPSPERVNEDA